jgi:hypothetical protein
MNDNPTHAAEWTDDCQGKKDFDGDFVSVSTRYWPGYYTVFNTARPDLGLHEIGDRRPSAHSAIIIRVGTGSDITLTDRDFDGATEEEVKRAVEAWVDEQFARVVKAMKAEFPEEVGRGGDGEVKP